MGIIKAVGEAVGKSLADQWLEVVEAEDMGDQTVFVKGVKVRTGQNKKGSSDVISNGSVIHVYPNQFMMLVDGGRVVDYTAEEGYYKVDDSSMPSLFNGQFGDTLRETFNRIRFGGVTPTKQEIFFINLQEIKGIRFGTKNPVNYFDNFYNSELFLRAHGTYSIKITDPLKFYSEVIPKNETHVDIDIINEQYLSEFLAALQASINLMSAEGTRISYVSSKSVELGKYMSDTLDSDWNQMRGMEIQAVGIASISYDEESQKLINMRNQGAMLSDPGVREGYVQGAVARGMEAAGSNANGSMAGFMGMGVGMNAGGGFMGAASQSNMQQMQMRQTNMQQMPGGQSVQQGQMNGQPAPTQQGQMGGQPASVQQGQMGGQQVSAQQGQMGGQPVSAQQGEMNGQPVSVQPVPAAGADGWICSCGTENRGKFCSECGSPRPLAGWTCGCGAVNVGKFCSECGKPRV